MTVNTFRDASKFVFPHCGKEFCAAAGTAAVAKSNKANRISFFIFNSLKWFLLTTMELP